MYTLYSIYLAEHLCVFFCQIPQVMGSASSKSKVQNKIDSVSSQNKTPSLETLGHSRTCATLHKTWRQQWICHCLTSWRAERITQCRKLEVFGCKAYAHVLKVSRQKWDPKVIETIFIGCPRRATYLPLDPKTRRNRDVIFFEEI